MLQRNSLFVVLTAVLSVINCPKALRGDDEKVIPSPNIVNSQPHDCGWLLRYGIHDSQRVAIDRYTVEHLRFLLSQSKAETIEQFKQEAGAGGLSVFGLFEINLGGKSATKDFRAWREEFLTTTTHDLLKSDRLQIEIKKVSPVLMDAVKHCLDKSHPGKVVGWIEPSKDDLTFTLHLRYDRLPSENEGPEFTSVSFTTSPPGQLAPLNEAEAESIKKGQRVRPAGMAVTFQRMKPLIGITVTVNTKNHGAATFTIPAVDPDETINRLNRKIADLENKIDRIEASINTGVGVAKAYAYFDGKEVDGDRTYNISRVEILGGAEHRHRFHFQNLLNNRDYTVLISPSGVPGQLKSPAMILERRKEWFDVSVDGGTTVIFVVVFEMSEKKKQ
jgi:hypothetical protein